MTLKPADLNSSEYLLMDSVGHYQLLPFVKQYLHKKTWLYYSYWLLNILLLCVTVWLLITKTNEAFPFYKAMSFFTIGVFGTMLLIPLHEYIHVLAYKSMGASNTYYDSNIRKLYFMAIADGFVASKKEFYIVALAPLVVITCLLAVVCLFVSTQYLFVYVGTMLVHVACCSGDIGMLNYFIWHKNKTIVTYDDKASRTSYFYEVKNIVL